MRLRAGPRAPAWHLALRAERGRIRLVLPRKQTWAHDAVIERGSTLVGRGRSNAPAHPCVLEARRARAGAEGGRRDRGQGRALADSRYDGREEARSRLEGQGALHAARAHAEHGGSLASVLGVLARMGSPAQAEARARAAQARARAAQARARARSYGCLGVTDLEKGQDGQRRGNAPAHRGAQHACVDPSLECGAREFGSFPHELEFGQPETWLKLG